VIKRRAEWEYPGGVKLIGEWSDLAGNRVFSLAEIDDPKAMLARASAWTYVTKLEIVPLMETEEMLKLLPKT
jgi:galactokinase